MRVSASLTERCNLGCDYCYASPSVGADMSETTLRRIIDLAVSSTPPGDSLELGLFGGEPLLRLDLIALAATVARARAREAGVPLRVQITTNGTLLHDAALAVLESHDIDLCVSIDGPPDVHDQHRRFRNGRGSAATVAANLERALSRLERVQVNAVYGPETVDRLPDTVSYLIGLGVRRIHLNLDIVTPWSTEAQAELPEAYAGVAAVVVDSYRTGCPVAVNLIDNKVLVFLKDGYRPEDHCGMGTTKIGFATDGSMYPCERLIGQGPDAELCFGSTLTGPDPERLASIRRRTGNSDRRCAVCPLQRFCVNWCGCTNFHLTGSTDSVAPVVCASEQAAIVTAHAVMTALADDELFAEHVYAYVHRSQHPLEGGRHAART